jgi:acetoin utilization protein AcuB
MTNRVITIKPNDNLKKARELLAKKKIRQLPVVLDRKLIGIVTDRDIRHAYPSSIAGHHPEDIDRFAEKMEVASAMSVNLVTVAPHNTVDEVAKILRDKRIGSVPVVQGDRLVGIITKTDILNAFLELAGVDAPSYRIDLVCEDKPGIRSKVRKTVERHGGEVKWISLEPDSTTGRTRLLIRITAPAVMPIEKALKKSGFDVKTEV